MAPTNTLIIMADQHNPKFLGSAGHPIVQTPNLDLLAQRGTRFARAYTNSPLCVPARAVFATGRYIHETGYWDNALAYDGKYPSWGHRLQANGNPVVSIGKLHYYNEHDDTGFDLQINPMHIIQGIGDIHGSIRPELPVRFQSRQYVEEVGPGETKYTAYDRDIVAQSCTWLKDNGTRADKPWVLFVSLICPHFPLIAPEQYYNLYPLDSLPAFKQADRELFTNHPWWQAFNESFIYEKYIRDDHHRKVILASYLGLCTFTDENVGRLVSALDNAGLNDTTRVVYVSDHGDNMGARGLWGKSTMHEESVGIPLIMTGPNIPKNKVSHTPVSLVDFFPTIIASAGAAPDKDDEALPGRSLLDVAQREDEKDRLVFSEYHAAGATSGVYMLRKDNFKLIYYADGFPPELYDLRADPEELENLAGREGFTAIVAALACKLREIVDADEVDRKAKTDQAKLIETHGGRDAIIARGAPNNTPVPGEEPVIIKQ